MFGTVDRTSGDGAPVANGVTDRKGVPLALDAPRLAIREVRPFAWELCREPNSD